jgi:beta-galactosidase
VGIFELFYRGAFEVRRQVRILHTRQLHDPRGERPGMAPESAAELHPVLIAPALYVADDGMLDWLGAYAEAGGHLVLGPRTGYGDHEAQARHVVTPARLVRAAGVRYDEFSNLHADLPLRTAPDSPLRLPAGAVATRWVEGLAVEDADVLAEYDHPHFGRWPAVTTRRHGGHRAGSRSGPRARREARAHAVQRLAGPAGLGHRRHRHRPRRPMCPCRPQLELAAGDALDGRAASSRDDAGGATASPAITAWAPHERRGSRRQRISRWSWSG